MSQQERNFSVTVVTEKVKQRRDFIKAIRHVIRDGQSSTGF